MHVRNLMAALVLAIVTFSGCSSRGQLRPRPFPEPGETPPASPHMGVPDRLDVVPESSRIVEAALELRGVPYRMGGADPSGFDCSGLVGYVYSLFGIALPRSVSDLTSVGTEIPPDRIQPGDLLFFSTVSDGPSHVAIAIDREKFVHAPSSRGVVRVEQLRSIYWASRFIGSRRIAMTDPGETPLP